MKSLFLLPTLLLIGVVGSMASALQLSSSLNVVSFKWIRSRQVPEKIDPPDKAPMPAMTTANKNFQRNVRVNDPVGARDPNADTIDGRSAAIERNVQESRTPPAKAVDGFSYRAKVVNTSALGVEIVFWEYQFIENANPAAVTRRQFLCGVNIKPGKEKELQAFSLSGPSDVISVATLSKDEPYPFKENVLINRVEYTDGSIWQRKDWNFGEIRMSYKRAIATPWAGEMCRAL